MEAGVAALLALVAGAALALWARPRLRAMMGRESAPAPAGEATERVREAGERADAAARAEGEARREDATAAASRTEAAAAKIAAAEKANADGKSVPVAAWFNDLDLPDDRKRE